MVVLKPVCKALVIYLLTVNQLLAEEPASYCQRLVTLAPSVTETVYFLGLGKQVVAVSEFDRYPQEVINKPRVGALFGTNLEALLGFRPTSVILLDEQSETRTQLERLGVTTLTLDHRNVKGILNSMYRLADYCQLPEAKQRADQLRQEYFNWQKRTRTIVLPAVLILLASGGNESTRQSAYVLGRDGFYADLISAAGGKSAYQGMTRLMPDVSMEGILALKPDVILVLTNSKSKNRDQLAEQIKKLLPNVPAVKTSRVHTISDDSLLIPGPRFLMVLQKFYDFFHP